MKLRRFLHHLHLKSSKYDLAFCWFNILSTKNPFKVMTPMYKRGAGLFVKTHHGRVRHVDESRSRDPAEWRMNHIRNFEGRGILLLRNPYTAVVSHWNHRLFFGSKFHKLIFSFIFC